MTNGDGANGGGALGTGEDQMRPGNTDVPGGQGGAAAMSVQGGAILAGTEDKSGARGKAEPDGADAVESGVEGSKG